MKDKYNSSFYFKHGKRLLDYALASVAIIVLSPLILTIAIIIRLKMGAPIIFKQKRPGLHGNPFTLYKFRSMSNCYDENGNLLPDKERLTKLGRFLRLTSLDELPELWNIIKGDMSIVGPRPLLMQYLDKFTHEQNKRHEVLPGLTGLAQVEGRNRVLFSRRLELDVAYVRNMSFPIDIKLILYTIKLAYKKEGVIPDQDVHDIDDLGFFDAK
jgi:lipopolysaccharide/colanic/teichoic acid biosynthesis glycosyltransferase